MAETQIHGDPALVAAALGVSPGALPGGNGRAQGVMSPFAAAAALKAAAENRPRYTFQIPAGLLGQANGITALSFVKLQPDEELAAADAAQSNPARMAWELARVSLRGMTDAAGEHRIDPNGPGAEAFWRELDPMIRTLCVTAYGSLHNPKEDQTKDFLGSCSVKV